jgi:hypothetical protein
VSLGPPGSLWLGEGCCVSFVLLCIGADFIYMYGEKQCPLFADVRVLDYVLGVTRKGSGSRESSQSQGLSCPLRASIPHASTHTRGTLVASSKHSVPLWTGNPMVPCPPPSTTHLVLGLVRLCTLCNPQGSLVAHISMGSRFPFGAASTVFGSTSLVVPLVYCYHTPRCKGHLARSLRSLSVVPLSLCRG